MTLFHEADISQLLTLHRRDYEESLIPHTHFPGLGEEDSFKRLLKAGFVIKAKSKGGFHLTSRGRSAVRELCSKYYELAKRDS